MKRPDESHTEFAMRLLGDGRQREIIEKIDAKLQEFDPHAIEGVEPGIMADTAIHAVEEFAGSLMDELRKELED